MNGTQKRAILAKLKKHGNVTRACSQAGVTRMQFYYAKDQDISFDQACFAAIEASKK